MSIPRYESSSVHNLRILQNTRGGRSIALRELIPDAVFRIPFLSLDQYRSDGVPVKARQTLVKISNAERLYEAEMLEFNKVSVISLILHRAQHLSILVN